MDQDEFTNRLERNLLPVVVDIWAPWCLPCRTIEPALDRLKQEYHGRVDLLKLNADENTALIQALGVSGVPTLLVYRNAKQVARRTGSQPYSELASLFEAALTGDALQNRDLDLPNRLLRTIAGLSLFGLGWLAGGEILLFAAGGFVLFLAVYDRCPIWRAITSRLIRPARKQKA